MASSQLVDRVSCVVCMVQYNRTNHVPKLLACQHTFCEVCINSFTDKYAFPRSLHCPTCRRYHVIPREGFVTNRVVLDIVDELRKDTTRQTERALKCTKHANKEAVMVCIECLDALCVTCVRASSHSHAQHHMEEPDVAKSILQQKFIEERSKVQEIKSSAQEQERETNKEKDTIYRQDLDLTTLLQLCKIQHNKHGHDVKDDDFMNKLQLRETKGDELGKLDERLIALLDGMRLEIKSKTSFQSKLLKKEGLISATQRSKQFTQGANDISEIPSFGRISNLSNLVLLLLANLIVMTLVFFASYSFIKITFGLSPIERAVKEAVRWYGFPYISEDEMFTSALLLYMAACGTSFVMQIIGRRILTYATRDKTFLSGLAYFCKFFFTMLGISCSPFWCLSMHLYNLNRMLPIVFIPVCLIQWISPERMRRCIYRQQAMLFSNQGSAPKKPLFGRICDSGNRWKLFCITILLFEAYIAINDIFLFVHGTFVRDIEGAMVILVVEPIIVFILQLVTHKVITMKVMGNSYKDGVKYTCQFFFMMLGIMSTVILFRECAFSHEANEWRFIVGIYILSSLVQLAPYQ